MADDLWLLDPEVLNVMTSEREAKVWMLAAGAMVVWACTMVGCTASSASGPATPLNRPTTATIDPTWSSTPGLTLSPDTASEEAGDTAASALGAIDSASVFAPSQPDASMMRPRAATSPRFDIELSGLSIAQPLVSAKRLLVAAVTALPPVVLPESAHATSAVIHGELTTQPVAASLGITQRLAFEQPLTQAGTAGLGVAILDRNAVMLPPWQTDPTPTPTAEAAMTADVAKFDSAGVVMMVLGAMVLLFGGEAVVLLMIDRRSGSAQVVETPVAEVTEESIFRFPEAIDANADQSFSSRSVMSVSTHHVAFCG